MEDIHIKVGNSSYVSNHIEFAEDSMLLWSNETFYGRRDMIGQYVSVQMKAKGVMRICEVEVWGYIYKSKYNFLLV